jgi:hypothetical protein
VTSGSSINFILANQWSHRPHGHGQTELAHVKSFLLETGQQAVVLSRDGQFGDYKIDSKDRWASKLPKRLQRGPLFRRNNNLALKDQCESWVTALNYFAEISSTSPRLLITSSSFVEVKACLEILEESDLLFCRITHFEESFLSSKKNLDFIVSAIKKGRLKLAVETSDAAQAFTRITGEAVQVVLPAQGLILPRARNRASRKTLGLLWPLTSYAPVSEVENFLNALPKNINVCIRLPHRISKDELSSSSQDWHFLEHGVSELEYLGEISALDFVVLPHNGYFQKGSGLAFEFVSLGIPLLTHYANSFIKDIPNTILLNTFEDFNVDEIRQKISSLVRIEIKDSKSEAEKIRRKVRQSWSSFLDQ